MASASASFANVANIDTEGLNLKYGPALIAANFWPARKKETMSQFPDGVSVIVETLSTFELSKRET